jgi:hypothetical protein
MDVVDYLADVHAFAADITASAERLRRAARDLSVLPGDWYLLTELLIAASSLGFALADIIDRQERR